MSLTFAATAKLGALWAENDKALDAPAQKITLSQALQALTDNGVYVASASASTNYSAGNLPELDLHLTISPDPKASGDLFAELHAWVASHSPWGKK